MLKKSAQEAAERNLKANDLLCTVAGELLDAGADIVTVQGILATVTQRPPRDMIAEESARNKRRVS
jgi:hypothetical protein